MHRPTIRWTLAVAAVLAVAPRLSAQPPATTERKAALTVDSLLAGAGQPWTRYQSPHFALYTEYPGTSATAMLDSLEAALSHASQLLGAPVSDGTTLTVFVTGSRTRFPLLMAPTNKGVWTTLRDGRGVVALVVNDSVRSYARHEVMHAVGFRTWGPQSGYAEWLSEGLATFADGRCQGVPIVVVARDLLRQQPTLTVQELTQQFPAMRTRHLASAYVLAGSLIEFLWSTRGRDGVHRVWQGAETLVQSTPTPLFGATAPPANGTGALRGQFPSRPTPLSAAPAPDVEVTRAWRAYVERVAGTRPGLTAAALQRHGCG